MKEEIKQSLAKAMSGPWEACMPFIAKSPFYLQYLLDEVDRLEAKLFLANQKIAEMQKEGSYERVDS